MGKGFETRVYGPNGAAGGGGGTSFTGNPSIVVVTDGAGALASSAVSTTTLGYLDATSSIQTQLNAKAPLASPTFTGTVTTSAITANGTVRLNGDLQIQEQGGTDLITIRAAASAAARVYTIPDAGADSEFVMKAGASTISGAKTFSADVTMSSANIVVGGNAITGVGHIDSTTANRAAAGIVRLANTDVIAWRNAANGGDLTLQVNASDQLVTTAPIKTSDTTVSSTTTTGSGIFGGGVGIAGALNAAGTVRFTNVTDASSSSSPGALGTSGGCGIAKKLYVGTQITLEAGNVLIASGSVGRDTGVSGSLTDCPTNVYTNFLNVKTGIGFAANSASSGLSLNVDSATSITVKNGGTSLFSVSSTQLNIWKKMSIGVSENLLKDFCTGSTTTTDGTATNLYTLASASNWFYNIVVRGLARRSDAGTEQFYFNYVFHVSNVAGTMTLQGTPEAYTTAVSASAASIACNFSGTTIRIQATGEAAKTYKWFWDVEILSGSA